MPYSDPVKLREYMRKYHAEHREALNARSRERGRAWRATNRQRLHAKYINRYYSKLSCWRLEAQLHTYGMSFEEFGRLLIVQNGACAICEQDDKRLCIDHDHATGQIRGLICDRCNGIVLVVLERYGHLLDPARAYLSKYQTFSK